MNSSSMPTMEKQKKKKCSSLEHETSFNAKQKNETSKKSETGANAKQKSLDESSNGKCEKPGFFERKGQQLKQKLIVKSDSCDSGTKKAAPRKIGIFKEKCLEMPDESNETVSTISNPERSDFLGGRRGMTKQKNVELAELPDFLGPPEKASRVLDTPDILGSKMTDVPDFLGPPEKFDSAPRSRSQSIEVRRVFLVAMIQYWLQVAEEVASSLVVTMRLETDSDRRVSISCAPPSFKVILRQKKIRAEYQSIGGGEG